MRSATKRHRRLAAACALISALTLGGVYAGQAVAAGSPSSSDGDSSSGGGSSSPKPPKDDDSTDWKRQDEASRAYTECMRDNGLEDFPDIVIWTADGGRGVKVRIDRGEGDGAKRPDPASKEFRKAAKACQDILDDIGVKLPVPPGDLPGKGGGPFPAPGGCGEIRQHEKGSDGKGSGDRREDGEGGDTESSVEGLVLSG
ncbi:hypothetical protein ACFU96_38515 [Streptomyces sp. NPDC057620]|uniref:hypothetical protein n=1 Tax=Streptomyces sp. NPDC057620 TaxID=3346185 RepID=UPI0036B00CEE